MIMGDGIVYYYDEKDIEQNQPYKDIMALLNNGQQDLSSRSNDGFNGYGQEPGYFGMFADRDFTGASITKSLTNFHYTYDLPNLGSLDMNDKISSISLAYNGTDPIVC